MKVRVQCLYCGKEEELIIYSKSLIEDRKCEKCGDMNKKIREIESKNVFGYDDEGTPKLDNSFLRRD